MEGSQRAAYQTDEIVSRRLMECERLLIRGMPPQIIPWIPMVIRKLAITFLLVDPLQNVSGDL